MSLFTGNVIRKRVMEVVEQKIQDAQTQHDAEVDKLEAQLEDELDRLHEDHQARRSAVVDRLVGEILGKIF